MQSVHACAVQTHFSVFSCFLKERSLEGAFGVRFGVYFGVFLDILVTKRYFKKCFKKRCPSRLKQGAINNSGGSRTAPLAHALFKQETTIWTATATLSSADAKLLARIQFLLQS